MLLLLLTDEEENEAAPAPPAVVVVVADALLDCEEKGPVPDPTVSVAAFASNGNISCAPLTLLLPWLWLMALPLLPLEEVRMRPDSTPAVHRG